MQPHGASPARTCTLSVVADMVFDSGGHTDRTYSVQVCDPDTCNGDKLIPKRHNYKGATCCSVTRWHVCSAGRKKKKPCSKSDD